MPTTHYSTCNLCEAMCGIAVTLEDNTIQSIRGDDADPFSRGHICPKAAALKDLHEDPDRLKRPMMREGAQWREVGWDEAFNAIAQRLAAIRKAHGRRSVALYQGNPTVHNYGSIIYGQVFARALRTPNNYSATSLDQLPHMLASLEMFGHQLLLPVPDVDRTDYFLVIGANPAVSNGSIMTAPGIIDRIKAIRARGGKVVVVDPRFTETARLADRHVPIRPGTDALLLAAIANELLSKGANLGRLADFTDGLDTLRAALRPFTAQRVAEATGISAEQIRQLANELSEATSSACYGRVGVCTQALGGVSCWLINVVNVLTGNLDREGGMMFTTPAVDVLAGAAKLGLKGSFDRRKSRVRGLPEFGGEFPTATLAEEILTEGEGKIRALFTSAGNPVLSAPNGRLLDEALSSLELMVSIDIYLNETTRHAHFILPPTFGLEHDNYDLVFHLLAVRNTAKYCHALFPRDPDARHDWEIFLELATRIAPRTGPQRWGADLAKSALLRLGPTAVLDFGLRMSGHGTGYLPFGGGLSLAKLKDAPHGIDLGPLQPVLPDRLYTSDHKIHLAPKLYLDDLARAERELDRAPANGDLSLIGRRELRSNNSWMHNSHRLVKGKMRCTLLMHPDDAEARSLEPGAEVKVTSRAGTSVATLEVSDEMKPGVVSLPHGWGHDRDGIRLSVASERPGVSINDLTDELRVDDLTGTIAFSDVPVQVTRT